MRVRGMTTLFCKGVAPPERPVPAPRGRKGMPCALKICTTRCTSSVEPGNDGRREETLDGEGIALVYDAVAFLSQYVGRSDNLDQLIDNLGR